MFNQTERAYKYIVERTSFKPEAGIILGTGLGGLVTEIEIDTELEYEQIPDFPISTVESHHGKLIFGTISGKRVVAMKGRFHYYEGYTMQQVAFPVQVMKRLGVKHLFVSNASGALNKDLHAGDLMIIKDHINLQPGNPLIGPNDEAMGPRFPDMANAYNPNLIQKALKIARDHGIPVKTGIYVSVPGPVLETPAEYRYLRIIGGDAVGMSTVPEIIAARHAGMRCFAISIISDEGWHDIPVPITIDQIIAVASVAEPKMTLIIKDLLQTITN